MNNRFFRGLSVIFTLAVPACLAVAIVSASDNLDPTKYDGRINQAEVLGGNAIYCIDNNGLSTSNGWSDGGIRVLDSNGQIVFFAPAAEIDALGVPDVNTLIETEGGLSLYRQPDGGFSLNGFDEWDKPFTFVFNDCVPIGPIPSAAAPKYVSTPQAPG